MIARDAVNYVMKYFVSDTDELRRVHLFIWPEPYDGARESREDRFSVQDLPAAEARARVEEFLAAARAQAASDNPAVARAAADAAARLEGLLERCP